MTFLIKKGRFSSNLSSHLCWNCVCTSDGWEIVWWDEMIQGGTRKGGEHLHLTLSL